MTVASGELMSMLATVDVTGDAVARSRWLAGPSKPSHAEFGVKIPDWLRMPVYADHLSIVLWFGCP